MTDIFKIDHSPDDTFFISDLHYTHSKDFILNPRGFASVEEANVKMVANWNAKCKNTSYVFHLGDFVFKDPTGEKIDSLFDALNFDTLFLLPGNHTSGYRQKYRYWKKRLYPTVDDHVDIYPLVTHHNNKRIIYMPNYLEISVSGNIIILSHYPIAAWNCQGKGAYHLSGHCHSHFADSNKDTGKGLQLDVGVESFGCPINWTEIKKHLEGREIVSVDHHHQVSTTFQNGEEDSPYSNRNNDKILS